MDRETTRHQWMTSSLDLMTHMDDWRAQHPTATLTEIEQALDTRLADLRAQMLQDLAMQSTTVIWSAVPAERPPCPNCAVPLQPRGRRRSRLRTQGGKHLLLQRPYGVCARCHCGFFPPRP